MKVLVTGGSGSVGKYIAADLVAHGHTVGVLDVVPPKQEGIAFHNVDVRKLSDVQRAMEGYDAVVHCAGIPHPLNDPPERVFDVNVNGTYAVVEAAARTGIRKLVFTSSESTLGIAFMTQRQWPLFAPVDETHPLRPQDPYGLSKVIGEQICRTATMRTGMRTVCLREPWIWVPEPDQIAFYRTLVRDYPQWYKNLWTYVHVLDVAQAHRLALETDLPELHDFFFITAKENWTGKDSRTLLAEFWPETTEFAPDFTGAQAIISHAKAQRLLGYRPQYSAADLFSA